MCKQPKLVTIDDDDEEGSIVTVDESDESEIEISDDEDGGDRENDEIPSNKKRRIDEDLKTTGIYFLKIVASNIMYNLLRLLLT